MHGSASDANVSSIFRLRSLYSYSTIFICEIRLFTDDCVCYREMKETDDILKIQKDIDQLGCWARKRGMRFQPVKCNMC